MSTDKPSLEDEIAVTYLYKNFPTFPMTTYMPSNTFNKKKFNATCTKNRKKRKKKK